MSGHPHPRTSADPRAAALDLVWSRRCPGCREPLPSAPGSSRPSPLCGRCTAALAALVMEQPVTPWPSPEGWPGCHATLRYLDPAAALLKVHKDGGRSDLRVMLARLLAIAVGAALRVAATTPRPPVTSPGSAPAWWVTPIPSTPLAARRRGEAPLERLSRMIPGLVPGTRHARLLGHRRRVRDQAGLSAGARRDNLRGALVVRPAADVVGARVVLVDDILTTGATLTEGRRALLAAGAAEVRLACVAAAVRVDRGGAGSGREIADP